MAAEDVNPPESRTPTVTDLVGLCRELNAHGARYVVVGGFAVIQYGYYRTTGDIDLLIDDALDNQQRVRLALQSLPEQAILELRPEEDLRDWVVLRVADEVLVDVMTAACGITYAETAGATRTVDIDGVPIRLPRRSCSCG